MAEERGSDAAGYLGWFFLGAIAGAAAAVLLTPKTGRETRELLAEVGMGYPTAKSHKLLGPRPAAQREHERREAEKAAKESDPC